MYYIIYLMLAKNFLILHIYLITAHFFRSLNDLGKLKINSPKYELAKHKKAQSSCS